MKHIEVDYATMATIADLILKNGTVVEDNNKYIIGFAKDPDIPVILRLYDKCPSCILINVDFDTINSRIISYFMKEGIYVSIGRSSQNFFKEPVITINLYSIE